MLIKRQVNQGALQVDQALACIDFKQGATKPVVPVVEAITPVRSEMLFHCEHFDLWRFQGQLPFTVGEIRMFHEYWYVSDGEGQIEYDGTIYTIEKGDVFLLPAVAGVCTFKPRRAVTLLEIALPE